MSGNLLLKVVIISKKQTEEGERSLAREPDTLSELSEHTKTLLSKTT